MQSISKICLRSLWKWTWHMWNKKNLIILNDLMNEVSKSLKITQLFTHGCHDNLSVIYLTQNLFHKNQRALSLNSDYMVIFRNPWDNSQFATIARQIHPDKVKFLMWTYKDAKLSPHTYLMLDLKPYTEERFRVRSNGIGRATTCIYNALKEKKYHL